MADQGHAWRASMSVDDRIKISTHVMGKLQQYYPNIPRAMLEENSRTFENQVFMRATNRSDYLLQVAKGIDDVEEQVNKAAARNAAAAAEVAAAAAAAASAAAAALRAAALFTCSSTSSMPLATWSR
eukprot:TRINITY_DN3263_c0_g1_i1.p5 TRINITY_DN3263_c0_g1~~TRINITY_DN3263_c0_g1_i1.p5  ORF type:complete len:127 (+),score=30.15 TRINITY_DN3263_c0_g1_i1:569-949(+)